LLSPQERPDLRSSAGQIVCRRHLVGLNACQNVSGRLFSDWRN
jgi:hypothetical protein